MLQQNQREVSAMTGNHTGILLERLEVLVGKLGMGLTPDEAMEIPALFDKITDLLGEMDPESNTGKSTAAQFETLSKKFRGQLGLFLREVGDLEKLEEARKAAAPAEGAWWWRPEEELTRDRSKQAKRALRNALIVVGVVAVLALVYHLFFQPDPAVVAVMDARMAAEQSIAANGDKDAALKSIEAGLAAVPGDGELLVLKGCVLTLIGGREAEAEEAFAEAEKIAGNRERVLLVSGQFYSNVGEPAMAQAQAEAAIALNPKSAAAYLLLGHAMEAQQNLNGAYEAYSTASTIGMEIDDAATTAQARINLGMLMQTMNMQPLLGEATLTPVP